MKRKMSLFVTASMVIASIGSTVPAFASEATLQASDYLTAYEMYNGNRENEFYGISTFSVSGLSEDGVKHSAFIEEWKNDLGIEIHNVESKLVSAEVLDNYDDGAKVWLYEAVTIDYMFPSEGFERTMEFGTEHIIKTNNDSGISILSDTYSEITGYETGTEEDLAILYARRESNFSVAEETNVASTGEIVTTAGYNHSAAVSYAQQYCGSDYFTSGMNVSRYNPSFYYYAGADCCNFVSQCLIAGGKSMSDSWWATTTGSTVPLADTDYSKSGISWRYVPSFDSYWQSKGYAKIRITSTSQAGAGNPIFWLKSDGYSTNHVMLIVGASNAENIVFVNAHNSDCKGYPYRLSDWVMYTFWF